MAGDGRVLSRVRMHALVLGAQLGHLVGGHADRVRYYLHEHLVVLDGGKVELLKAQIHRAVKPYCLCLHV